MVNIIWAWGIPVGLSCLSMVVIAIEENKWAQLIATTVLIFYIIYFSICIYILGF